MKKLSKFLTESLLQKLLIGILSISTLFIIIIYSLSLTEYDSTKSIWSAGNAQNLFVSIVGIILLAGFFLNLVLFIISVISLIWNKIKSPKIIMINSSFNIILIFILFIADLIFNLYDYSLGFILVFNIIINLVTFVFLNLYLNSKNKSTFENDNLDFNEHEQIKVKASSGLIGSKYFILVADALSMISLLLVLFIPMVTLNDERYIVNQILGKSGMTADAYFLGATIFSLFFIALLYFIFDVSSCLTGNKDYPRRSKILQTFNLVITATFFVISLVLVFYYQINQEEITTIAFIPFIIQMLIYFGYSYLQGKVFENKINKLSLEDASLKNRKIKKLKVAPLIFVFAFTLIIFSSLFLVLLEVRVTISDNELDVTKFKGLELLKTYYELNEVYQMITFIYVTLLVLSGILLILSIIHFLIKSSEYYKIIKGAIYSNIFFSSIFSLIGLFFMLNKKATEVHITTLLSYFGLDMPDIFNYTVRSQTWLIFLMAVIVLIMATITKQLQYKDEVDGFASLTSLDSTSNLDNNLKNTQALLEKLGEEPSSSSENTNKEELERLSENQNNMDEANNTNEGLADFDSCPAFSDIDSKKEVFDNNLKDKYEKLFTSPNLPSLIDFVVNYAANSRLHLSYTLEDIATFVAGLGTSRLAILQGMSGTGKTSLPKIFSEAIMGNVEIIEVESSWRDKNELLGYFNEFSQTYTPKKFTQSLYRAKLNQEVLTFIVLDEMNLSRIEYYFSDFLSLMEAEEHKREIKLLNVKLFRRENEELLPYLGLKDGHTIEIPTNIWFIGTANRDESTFEISNKVYDRAQTMNFNKRAQKIRFFSEEMQPKFLTYEALNNLFKEAKNHMEYDAENDPIIKEVEKLLSPYNISFGNRILNHIESFVKIYCACFINSNMEQENVLKNAVENIVFSKIVSKLEFKQIINKEKLAASFDKLELFKCSSFIRSLSED